MFTFLLGEKKDQTQIFDDQGLRCPATLIWTSPCYLIGVKDPSQQGYFAIKLGFKETKAIKKPIQGELKKAGVRTPLRFLREFRLEKYLGSEKIELIDENKKKGLLIDKMKIFVGDKINPTMFLKSGDYVDVSGISKGKGFQGVVKRYGFAGGSKTHGQKNKQRAPGSIGQTTTPGRVHKGKKMPGRMGNKRIIIRNLKVFKVTEDSLLVKGLLPGAKGTLLEIKSSNKQ